MNNNNNNNKESSGLAGTHFSVPWLEVGSYQHCKKRLGRSIRALSSMILCVTLVPQKTFISKPTFSHHRMDTFSILSSLGASPHPRNWKGRENMPTGRPTVKTLSAPFSNSLSSSETPQPLLPNFSTVLHPSKALSYLLQGG